METISAEGMALCLGQFRRGAGRSAEQAAHIVDTAWKEDEDWGAFVWLTMVTGMRRAELLGLRWHHAPTIFLPDVLLDIRVVNSCQFGVPWLLVHGQTQGQPVDRRFAIIDPDRASNNHILGLNRLVAYESNLWGAPDCDALCEPGVFAIVKACYFGAQDVLDPVGRLACVFLCEPP